MSAESFDQTLKRIATSKTYRKFCERVYGRDLTQYNSLDEFQLQSIIDLLQPMNFHRGLDLGCGVGRITEYISSALDANMTGIDFSRDIISAARERNSAESKVNFRELDFNSLPFDLGTFDFILAIDTLYFTHNLGKFLKSLKRYLHPHGYFVALHSFRASSTEPGEDSARESNLGEALSDTGFDFETRDFTANSQKLWEMALVAAEELKSDFENERLLVTYEGRAREARHLLNEHRKGDYRRAMFVAKQMTSKDS